MNFKEWNEIAELVGIAAVVASLVFVGLQMKQAQDIAQAERRSLIASSEIELANAIATNAESWVKGLAGEELDEVESVVFESLLNAKILFHQHTARAAQYLDRELGYQVHIAQVAALFHSSPGARRAWFSQAESDSRNLSLMFPMGPRGTFSDEVLSALAELEHAQH